ncbi:haloacid dehalogenase-like hydrolase [Croceicoccus ponticola]|uniref:haloacid dehalogenase-like hydrolase n=1 Tax=Croceicoccus ponticola TaxID=2217664 RepID=UPI0013E35621|nr:haloacid dehalogenase-like hydrolase [Croceicoccus ponticola]
MKRLIAIYDLDGTLLKHATFTPFLLFAARRHAPWKLALVPIWIGAMIAYKAGLFSREALKSFGLKLLVGRIDQPGLDELAVAFADKILPGWIGNGAQIALSRDRGEGRLLILATAAMEFYAGEIARRIGFDHVIATRHADPRGAFCQIEGGNCYGDAKVPRVEALLASIGLSRSDCDVRFYTDSTSDAPLLDWSDEPVLVDAGARGRGMAKARGWALTRFA